MRVVWSLIAVLVAVSGPAVAADLRIKTLKVLIPIYRGAQDTQGRLSDDDVAGIQDGIERGRLFYFRNTLGRLNLRFSYVVVDSPAPKNDGPTYEFIEKDLRDRGIEDNQYDGVFTTGVGLTGNWGGFGILGETGAAFGMPDKRGGMSWAPEDVPGVWYGAMWTFVHEFQHALDGPICGEGVHMLSGHPYSDCSVPWFKWGYHGGQHFSWEACTLREVGAEILDVPGATKSWLTVQDSDGDGLADDDPRLPMDEARFGSSPTEKDTDGDGLDDLHEFSADIFRGADPRNIDTDGDGVRDGDDSCPTVALVSAVTYSADLPAVDGVRDAQYRPLFLHTYASNSDALAPATVDACWNEDAVSLFVRTAEKCGMSLWIDSSPDNGFWEGGDTYVITASPDGKVGFSDLMGGDVPGAQAAWGGDGLEVRIPAIIGQGASNEINFGGDKRPQDVADGLALWGGGALGLNVRITAETGGAAVFAPNWEMFKTGLDKPATALSRPSLRYTKRLTSAKVPVAVVSGVRDDQDVETVNGVGVVVGQRRGPGEVPLTVGIERGMGPGDGSNELYAAASDGQVSERITLVVDDGAKPPKVTRDRNRLRVAGEPGATAEIFVSGEGAEALSVGTVTLDPSGAGDYTLPPSFTGYLGAYAQGTDFPKPAFYRIDPEIAYDYNDGKCDPRLASEYFCIVWTATLDVPADGDHTFFLSTDDGSRLFIDDAQVVDHWGHHGVEEKSAAVHLSKGPHALKVQYYEEDGWAAAHLEWSGPGIERTHALPVTALPFPVDQARWSVRQTDRIGNTSAIAPAG